MLQPESPIAPTSPLSIGPFDADVLIVGAGPAGLALSCALADLGLHVRVLEQTSRDGLAAPPEDGRDIALTHRSRNILQGLGLWDLLPPDDIAPLRAAQVTNGASPLRLHFDGRREGHEQLGWLVPNHRIRAACFAGALSRHGKIQIEGDARVTALTRDRHGATLGLADGRRLRAPLVVAADSRFSSLRRMAGIGARMLDFGRTAIVCRVRHELAHDGTARECFLRGHTLAMLPMAGDQSSAVWTVKTDGAAELTACSEREFAQRIEQAFGASLGHLELAGRRHTYPLVAVYAERFVASHFALIGDAAVGMHPVTAHGYNFGLYGIDTLSRELATALRAGARPGDGPALLAYERARLRATWPIYQGTNLIVRLFTDDRAPARMLREAVVAAAHLMPPVRQAVTRQLTGNWQGPMVGSGVSRLPPLPRLPGLPDPRRLPRLPGLPDPRRLFGSDRRQPSLAQAHPANAPAEGAEVQ